MTDDRPPRPDPVGVNPDGVPETLQERDLWLVWRYEWKWSSGEWSKTPKDGAGGDYSIDATDPDNGVSFEAAMSTYEDGDYDGLGVITDPGSLLVGFDFDDCRDPTNPGDSVPELITKLLGELNTYTELSPSKTGFRAFAFGTRPGDKTRDDLPCDPVLEDTPHLEIYDGTGGRYLTVTGQHLSGTPTGIETRPEEIEEVYAEYIVDDEPEPDAAKPAGDGGTQVGSSAANPTPDAGTSGSSGGSSDLTDVELIERAKDAENGDKFQQLWDGSTAGYESHSEADLALAGLLAFWTGGDRQRIDRLFRDSGLYRDKWGEDRGSNTYGELTIEEALRGRTEFYDPPNDDTPPVERVDSELIDALLADPGAWVDPETQTWTVRDTDDHDAEEIAAALRDGDLPGDAWGVFADAALSGDLSDHIREAVTSWREDPDAWTVETSHEFDETELAPDALAADLGVPLSELGEERNGRLAYHVWDRIRAGDHAKVVARTGVDGDDELLSYHDDRGVWREDGEEVLRTLGRDALGEIYSRGVERELTAHLLATRSPGEPWGQKQMDKFGADPNTVPVANGTLDLTDRELRPREPTEYALAALPVEYDPDAECPTFESYLKDVCQRSVDRKKLQEYVGYTLMHWDLPYHKALFLAGPQASGKSTFLDTVNALLGGDPTADRGTTCSLSPKEMTEERFAGYGLRKAWANIRSDIPNDLIENTGKFKELVAGDPVKVEKKYHDPITIRPTAKHLFAANTLPSADVDDDAFFRRILLVSFPNTVPRDDRDPDLGDKLAAELSGILNWALDGLDRLREQGYFTGSPTPADIQAKWREWGNSVDRFKQRILENTGDPTDAVPKQDALEAYRQYCETEGIPAKSRQTFYDNLKRDADIGESRKKIDGSRTRAYTSVKLRRDRINDTDTGEDTDAEQDGLF